MNQSSKIFVAGHKGMVGRAILETLKSQGFTNFVFRSSSELDLRDSRKVKVFFEEQKPEYVFLAAAKVGGILANNIFRAEFLYDNLMIEANVIHQSYLNKVKKLLFLGSTCIYPKLAPQPLKEEYLLSNYLEPTNEPYAIAKIAGIKLCQAYRDQYDCNFVSVMPTNLYGPNDNFNLETSHVLPAMIHRMHLAKVKNLPETSIWGTGKPLREFLHVHDLADACIFVMKNYDEKDQINIGYGKDISIKELAMLIKKIVGYHGELVFDSSKPDGTPRKLADSSKLRNFGWQPRISLEEGIKKTYEWFLDKQPFD